MTETEYKQPTSEFPQNETLLDRLKRIKEHTDRTNVILSHSIDSIQPADDKVYDSEFIRKVNILKAKAKTEAYTRKDIEQSDKMDLVNLINVLVIVPDEVLANAGENEINITTFVRRYLPKEEWPNYIPEINL